MTYKTIVIDYVPKAKKMAAAIEKTANEKAQDGWELVTFSVTNSAKAILVFRMPESETAAESETPTEGETADKTAAEEESDAENTAQEETAEAVGDTE